MLLFQVMIDPCKLACLFRIWVLVIFKESLLWRSSMCQSFWQYMRILWKKILKATSQSSVESLYSSCHFCQFASNSLRDLQVLIQPKNDSDYSFWTQKNWHPNSTFFNLPVLSKTVENEKFNWNGIIPCSKILTQIKLYLKTRLIF